MKVFFMVGFWFGIVDTAIVSVAHSYGFGPAADTTQAIYFLLGGIAWMVAGTGGYLMFSK